MIKYFLLVLCNFIYLAGISQNGIGIGTVSPHSSAILDLTSINKGLLIPRMTQTERIGIDNPADGLMVYDITSNHLYQYQDGIWRFLLDNGYWTKSSTYDRLYTFDSVGIGNAAPTKRLDVSGSMRGRSSLEVGNNMYATDSLKTNNISMPGYVLVNTSLNVDGLITGNANINIDNASPILQIKNGSENKVYIQASGNDLRIGTNSGNDLGKMIIRMNGSDIISIDTFANFKVLNGSAGHGNFSIGYKAARQIASNDNMLPTLYGKVNASGSVVFMSGSADVTRISDGVYEIQPYGARLSVRSSFVVTAGGTAPRICSAEFLSPLGKIKIEIYDPVNRVYIDTDFNFIAHEPLNL